MAIEIMFSGCRLLRS